MLSDNMSQNLCSGCDLCCRKYKIYLFPKEAKAIAKRLKISNKIFVEKYLDYYLELFSLPNSEKTFFVSLALKQKNNCCIFLKNKDCTIYSARPLICRLFPNFKFYNEEFSFCKLDKCAKKKDPRQFYPIMQKYLQDVQKKGLKKVWGNLPALNEKNLFVVEDSKRKKYSKEVREMLQSVL